MKPSDLVSTRSTPYRKERLAERNLPEEALLEMMLEEPRLIRRPILLTDDDAIVGFDRGRYEDIARSLADREPDTRREKESE